MLSNPAFLLLIGMIILAATAVHFWPENGLLVARNISVLPLPEEVEAETAVQDRLSGTRLSQLPLGETAEVIRISSNCRGAERRRFMDLGILPGTAVTAEMCSPSGEPTAYRIRDAIIALRSNQANHIYVKQVI
jgi:DtxR family Mn-dependent transcriptional regulator